MRSLKRVSDRILSTPGPYDGKYVLQTNTDLSSEKIARAYRNLRMIEHAFRNIKDIFKTKSNLSLNSISGKRAHLCLLLFFLLTASLQRRLSEIKVTESVWKVIRDVHRVKAVKLFVKEQGVKPSGTPHF